jgi:7-cyano-7-deazaguanine synthase
VTTAILLSGGVDSNAVAWWQRPEIAFTLDYGQLAAASEIGAAREIARLTGMHHEIVRVDSSPDALAPVTEWWPYRNQLLVTLAAARGISLGVRRILVGAVVTDASHTDGTPAFFSALDALMRLQEGEIAIEAPAISMSTVELVRVSGIPREVLAWSHSCHTGPLACGGCRGCVKHFQTMNELYGEAY